MTTSEFCDYVLAISAQAGADPTVASVLDASIVVEFILPFVLREAVRNAWQAPNTPQSLVRAHAITITNGFSSLPAGVEEEFAKSFEVGLKVTDLGGPTIPDNLVATPVSSVAITLTWDASADIAAEEFVVSELGLWSLYEHYGDFVREADELLPRFCVRNSRIFVDRDGGVVDDTVIVLYGVTIPQVPTNPDEDIPAPEFIMDDCMGQVTDVLQGRKPLSMLGVPSAMLKKAA